MDAGRSISYGDIREGSIVERDYACTTGVYEHFLRAFDDRSPIHVDATFAKAAGFAGPVMHGGMLNGFVSHFVGMVFPGITSLLVSSELRFLRPVYLGDTLRLQAKVAQKVDAQQMIVLHLAFHNQTRDEPAASGRVLVKVSAA